MSIEISKYLSLKKVVNKLVDDYPVKYILKALGEVCLTKGDQFILIGMESGQKDKWSKGEMWCKIGKAIIKLTS